MVQLVPSATTPEIDGDAGTRDRVRSLVVGQGPIGAARLAVLLDLTPAGVRRHLTALVAAGEIAERTAPTAGPRGRGRPAREYVATAAAQGHLADASSELAAQAMHHIAALLGPDALTRFAEERLVALEAAYRPVVEAAGPDLHDRARALAAVMSGDGYAASTRDMAPTTHHASVQLCQGHCPVQHVAAEFPQLCEAETRLISRLLGVHVQRLATIVNGGHACTTHIPILPGGGSAVPVSIATSAPVPPAEEGPA